MVWSGTKLEIVALQNSRYPTSSLWILPVPPFLLLMIEMATFYICKADAQEVNQEALLKHPGLEALIPLVEDLRAATTSSLQCNGLLGWDKPIFSCKHVSMLTALRTPLECLCPFSPMAEHREMLVFQRVHHNIEATPTHVIVLMEHWREAKEAALDAECTTKLKIPAPLRALIY